MKTSYTKLLNHPLWRRKRKSILKRDGNKCTVCGSTDKLHIHHTYYYKVKVKPWEYPDRCFLTLCEDCHNDHHRSHENVYRKNPTVKVRKVGQIVRKVKIIKEGVSFKKKKVKKQGKAHKQHRYNSKPCLASSQALRLGYRRDNLGHWIKENEENK
jgi:hypothetical protein